MFSKKLYGCCTILVILFQVVSAWGAAPIRIVLFPAADSLDETSKAELNVFTGWLAGQKNLSILPADSVDRAIGDRLSPLFYEEYEPFSLALVNQRLRLDAAFFITPPADSVAGVWQLTCRAFPSGALLAQSDFLAHDLKNIDSLAKLPAGKILSNALQLARRPFREHERGILVLVSDLADSGLVQQGRALLSQLDIHQGEGLYLLNIKPWPVIPTVSADRLRDLARSEMDSLAADMALLVNRRGSFLESQLVLPRWNWPAEGATALPLPGNGPGLACANLPADSGSILTANRFLFGGADSAWSFLQSSQQTSSGGNQSALVYRFLVQQQEKASPRITHDSLQVVDQAYLRLMDHFSDAKDQAWILANYSQYLQSNQREENALLYLAQADSTFLLFGDNRAHTLCLWQRGRILSKIKRWSEALTVFSEINDHMPASEQNMDRCELLQRIANLFELNGQSAVALDFYAQTATLYEKLNKPYEAAQIYSQMGQLSRQIGEPRRAMTYLDTYLTRAKSMNSEPALGRAHFQKGVTLLSMDDLDQALNAFRSAVDYFELLSDTSGMAKADVNMGIIYQRKGDNDMARQHYQSALHMAKSFGDVDTELLCNINLAELASATASWQEVQAQYDQALIVARVLKNPQEEAKIVYAKGLSHLKEGRLQTGYQEIKEALALAGGTVSGDEEKEQQFLLKLESLIADIQNIHAEGRNP